MKEGIKFETHNNFTVSLNGRKKVLFMVITDFLVWEGKAYAKPEIIAVEFPSAWFGDNDPLITITVKDLSGDVHSLTVLLIEDCLSQKIDDYKNKIFEINPDDVVSYIIDNSEKADQYSVLDKNLMAYAILSRPSTHVYDYCKEYMPERSSKNANRYRAE